MSGKVTVPSNRAPTPLAGSEWNWVPHFSRTLREVGILFCVKVPGACFHHRIISPTREWMTPQQPHQSHPSTPHRPVAFHGLHRILRTSRHKPASRRKQRRDRPLVSPQQLQHNEFGELAHEFGFRLPASGYRSAVQEPLLQRASVLLLRTPGSLRSRSPGSLR